MNNLIYQKGDLFSAEAEENALNLLLHSCNCMGVWGSGVAKQFKQRFPGSFEEYELECTAHEDANLGQADIFSHEDGFNVVALYTSAGFGPTLDRPEWILEATKSALQDLENQITFEPNVRIHSPKINSGLFKTPWEDTEKLIIDFLSVRPDIVWTVWELE